LKIRHIQNHYCYYVFLVKLDNDGQVVWSKTYGTAGREYAYEHGLDIASHGGFALTGKGGSGQNPVGIFWLKTDSVGNLQWAKNFPGIGAHSIKRTNDNGYVVVGTELSGNTSFDPILLKSDFSGNLLWNKVYVGILNDVSYDVVVTNDEGYALAGRTSSFGSGGDDSYLIKTDANGNTGCNDSTYDTNATNAPFIEAIQTILTGSGVNTVSYPNVMYRGLFVTDPCLSTEIVSSDNNNQIKIFPNPSASGVFYLSEYSNEVIETIVVRNWLGEIIYEGKTREIDLRKSAKGMYLCIIKLNDAGLFCSKIIIE
jgi:hypothetical protein